MVAEARTKAGGKLIRVFPAYGLGLVMLAGQAGLVGCFRPAPTQSHSASPLEPQTETQTTSQIIPEKAEAQTQSGPTTIVAPIPPPATNLEPERPRLPPSEPETPRVNKPALERDKPIDVEAERAKLREAENAFARRCEEKGAAQAFYEYLAPDARLLPSGQFPIRGRDAIRVQLAANPEGVLVWKAAEILIAASADLGHCWGTYELRTTGLENQVQIQYGKYVRIWKKQTDGSWKISLEADNPSPPPTARR